MRALVLTLLSYQGRPCEPHTRRVESGRLTIGRSAECDWELSDPERELSRFHCSVERLGDGYTITEDERCSHGVFMNGAAERLGRNVSMALGDRDEFEIGPYRVRAELEAAAASPGTAIDAIPDPFAAPPPLPGSNLSWFSPVSPAVDRSAAAAAPIGPLWPAAEDAFPARPRYDMPPLSSDGWPAPAPEPFPPPSPLRDPAAEIDRASALRQAYVAPPISGPVIPADWDRRELEEPGPAPSPQPAVPPPTPPAAAAVPVPPRPPPPATGDAVRAFLQGAGLSEQTLPPGEDDLARLRMFGALFREIAAGVLDLVAARSMVKAGFHVAQTVVAERDNNPFKFSVGVDELLAKLLTTERQGYAQPLPAIREAIQNLKEHDLALIGATQSAVADLLARLSPPALQRAADAAGLLGNLLPGARKAAWWDAFEQTYRRAVEGMEADLPGGFRQNFAEAYAKQAKRG
ncbi:MAG TPA: type VI secretion system-associated FHA domain protein TagH [Stellaceae bacterium]|nr:type VI secretion system-associated FHA domain protein TagH [Stellaceae bacterium]